MLDDSTDVQFGISQAEIRSLGQTGGITGKNEAIQFCDLDISLILSSEPKRNCSKYQLQCKNKLHTLLSQ